LLSLHLEPQVHERKELALYYGSPSHPGDRVPAMKGFHFLPQSRGDLTQGRLSSCTGDFLKLSHLDIAR
jgi:hypothetical protein